MHQVIIKNGNWRNQHIEGTFDLIRPYKDGVKGGFITIRNTFEGNDCIQRVKVGNNDYEIIPDMALNVQDLSAQSIQYQTKLIESETDEETMIRIRNTFDMLDKLVDGAARGYIRGLIVSGSPGIGKSYGVEAQLELSNLACKLGSKPQKHEFCSGVATPLALYKKLYRFKDRGQILVLDDIDNVFLDDSCLSLLKSALNSGDRRRISWLAESRILQNEGIPTTFDYSGSIIVLTNTKFDNVKGRIGDHLKAVMSRCHYYDMEIDSTREILLRMKQVIADGMFEQYEFSKAEEQEIVNYVYEHVEFMRRLSLREVKKLADLKQAQPENWKELAEATILNKEARFKRLFEEKTLENV